MTSPSAAPLARTAVATRRRRRPTLPGRLPSLEALERRALLTVVVGTPLGNTFGLPAGAPTVVDLAGAFDSTDVVGTVVRVTTSLGNIDVELYDQAAPRTAQNFVNYVANHLYDNTVVHRSDPGFILQAGGYKANAEHIVQGPPVKNEYGADRPNVRGTLAMAKLPATDGTGAPVPGGGPDSATSEWFVNLADSPGLNTQNGGFTVFAKVINDTMETVDAIAGLSIYDATAVSPVFKELPVRNVPAAGANPTANDFVFVNAAAVIPETRLMTITATSDNPGVVNAIVGSNGLLALNYGATTGSARITVTATDGAGSTASQTFLAGNGELTVQIGSGGVGQAVAFTEADGGRGTVSLAKGGSAFVRFTGQGLAVAPGRKPGVSGTVTGIAGITAIDTTTNSTLSIKTKGGDGAVDLASLTTDGPLKALSLRPTRVTGTLTVGGTVKTATFSSLANANVTFGGDPADGIQLSLSLTTASNVNVTSGMPIKNVKATEFLSTTQQPAAITAPAVTTVSTKGAFQESLNTSGAIRSVKAGGAQKGNITGTALGSLSAASLEGGIISLTGGGDAVGKVAVRGAINNTTIRSGGNIKSIAADSINQARVYAGANVPDEEFPPFLPTDLAQFTAQARVGSVRVATTTESLSIAAAVLGKLSLGEVGTGGGIPFGAAATVIEQLAGRTSDDVEEVPSVPFDFRGLDDQAAFDAGSAGLPLGNFIVKLF